MAVLDRIKIVDQLEVTSRRVFVRVDFNVPLTDDKKVADDTRIREALPTIRYLVGKGARVVLASHLGRPKKDKKAGFSLEPAALRLAELLGMDIVLADDCIGDGPKKVVSDLRDGRVVLLENLRYHAEEEANDDGFAHELAKFADVYINDAFGAAHRAHASVEALPRIMPERGAGYLLQKELNALGKLVAGPERPYVAVLGGAKVSDKIQVIEALFAKVDALLIGGAMANTFLAAEGKPVGKSLVENDLLDTARAILAKAKAKGREIVLPVDLVVAKEFKALAPSRAVAADAVGPDDMILDIGPRSVEHVVSVLARARTLVWNGPFGAFEMEPFDTGTIEVAEATAELTQAGKLVSVAGGGDTVAALNAAGAAERFSYVSTAGGAFLEWLEGKSLPGVEVLRVK